MARYRPAVRAALLAAIACAATAARAHASDSDEGTGFSGYYKNLLVRSRTLIGEDIRYGLDVNRLRLKKQGRLSDELSYDVQYDNEVLLGNYLDTEQYRQQKSMPTGQYWNLEGAYHERGRVVGRQRIYRGYLAWSSGSTDVRLGRQRIAWGSGRFWSPLDVLNPLAPTALERDERTGIDALLVEHKLSAVSRLSAVYAPQRVHGNDAYALQWHGNTAGVDFSLLAMRFMGARVLGGELAGQVGGAALRAEVTRTMPGTGLASTRAVAGIDYAFENTLALTAELHINGAGAHSRRDYDFASLFAGRIGNVGRRYAGVHAGYELTPLLKLNTHVLANLDDGSRFVAPGMTYAWETNLEVSLGMQYATGGPGSEFGRFRNVLYVQLQRYF